jgi:hypothetical protein
MSRGLSENFMHDLSSGKLAAFLDVAKNDHTLTLEIRYDYVNIYYRGGNLFRITPSDGDYKISFDENYCEQHKDAVREMDSWNYAQWIEKKPFLKSEMDSWFSQNQKSEKEFQQMILRENNFSSGANSTDYYIADVEYAIGDSRYDMLAIKWLSTSASRKSQKNISPAIIEVKYGDDALSGHSGIKDHFSKALKQFSKNDAVNLLCKDIETIYNQKLSLGLINVSSKTDIAVKRDEKLEYILVLINHKPAKSVLSRELKDFCSTDEYNKFKQLFDVKIAKACFMGYGLYEKYMVSIEEFIEEIEALEADKDKK